MVTGTPLVVSVVRSDMTTTPMNGVPTLMVRLGNERGNTIVDSVIRAVFTQTENTEEGVLFYRMYDLPLVRERAPALNRSWTVMHKLNAQSPLSGNKAPQTS